MDYAPNFINLIGQTFGELYVFEKAENDPKGCARFLARCSCGDERRYESKELRDLKRTACPKCLREAKKKVTAERNEAAAQKLLEERNKEKYKDNKRRFDISGLKIKDWTVLRPVKDGSFGCGYICECKCGTLFNFSRNSIIKSKTAQKCQKCLQKERDEERLTKIENVRNSGQFTCIYCDGDFELTDILPSNLVKGYFCCNSCHKINKDNFLNGWRDSHLEKELLECPECRQEIKIDQFRPSSLRAKYPKCNICKDKDAELAKDRYELKNRSKSIIKCCKCKEGCPIDSYYDSSLRASSPKCKKCIEFDKREYHKGRYKKDPIYKEKNAVSKRIRQSLEMKGWKKDATAATYLGIDKDGFIKYVESLFRGDMSWEDRSKWHLDHIIPLSQANTSEEIKTLWHHTNLQPLWKWENEEKSNRLDWMDLPWAEEVFDKRKEIGLK